ncbi:MAG: hypothetical protein ACREOH_16370 [Candidatus Entotheonellia bacterium]
MRAQVTLQPDQRGTKKLLQQHGEQLVCVRYRNDETRQRGFKTLELLVEETPWRPGHATRKGALIVGVRVGREVSLQRQVKLAGGRWNATRRVWELRRD